MASGYLGQFIYHVLITSLPILKHNQQIMYPSALDSDNYKVEYELIISTPRNGYQLCTHIARISLRRAIRSPLGFSGSTIRLQLFLASEFNLPIPVPGLLEKAGLRAFFLPVDAQTTSTFFDAQLKLDSVDHSSFTGTFCVTLPTLKERKACSYQLLFYASQDIVYHSEARLGENFSTGSKSSSEALKSGVEDAMRAEAKKVVCNVIPLLTATINVTHLPNTEQSDVDCLSSSSKDVVLPSQALLNTFRLFPIVSTSMGEMCAAFATWAPPLREQTIVVQEDYGSTMGAHVYDSAAVLVRWLRNTELAWQWRGKQAMALELGSGCGLAGLWLARSGAFAKVLLTDKPGQRTLLEANIARNISCLPRALSVAKGSEIDLRQSNAHVKAGEQTCEFMPLEWESQQQLDALFQSHMLMHHAQPIGCDDCSPALRLIVAADVLYGPQLVVAFFQVLRKILDANRLLWQGSDEAVDPTILVAQKVRSTAPVDLSAAAPDFRCECVFSEAEVKVWRLMYL